MTRNRAAKSEEFYEIEVERIISGMGEDWFTVSGYDSLKEARSYLPDVGICPGSGETGRKRIVRVERTVVYTSRKLKSSEPEVQS